MKVRASVKPICDISAKSLSARVLSGSSARIRSTNRDRVEKEPFDGLRGRELLFDTLLNLETA